MQAQADLLQRPVVICRTPRRPLALGAAALARLGTGDAASVARPWGRLRWKRSWNRRSPRIRRPNVSRFSVPPSTSRWRGDDASPGRRGGHRASVVGAAITRTLARYWLDLVLVDAAPDVGTGTSKANTAILHTGFDAKPGTLESRLLSRGSALLRAYAERQASRWSAPARCSSPGHQNRRRPCPLSEENARRNGSVVERVTVRRPAGQVTERPPAPRVMVLPPVTLAEQRPPRAQRPRAIVRPRATPEGGPRPQPARQGILRPPALPEDQGQPPPAARHVVVRLPVDRRAAVLLTGQRARVASGAAPLLRGVQSTQPRTAIRSAHAPMVNAVMCTLPDGTWIFIMG